MHGIVRIRIADRAPVPVQGNAGSGHTALQGAHGIRRRLDQDLGRGFTGERDGKKFHQGEADDGDFGAASEEVEPTSLHIEIRDAEGRQTHEGVELLIGRMILESILGPADVVFRLETSGASGLQTLGIGSDPAGAARIGVLRVGEAEVHVADDSSEVALLGNERQVGGGSAGRCGAVRVALRPAPPTDEPGDQGTPGLEVHVSLEEEDRVRVGKVVIPIEVDQSEAETIPPPLDSAADLDPLFEVVPGVGWTVLASDTEADEPVGRETEGQTADEVDGIRLAAGPQVVGRELVEVEGELDADVVEGSHVVERVDRFSRPDRNPRLFQGGDTRQREVPRIDHVGRREELRLAPDDGLTPQAQPQAALEELEVEVGLLELLGLPL